MIRKDLVLQPKKKNLRAYVYRVGQPYLGIDAAFAEQRRRVDLWNYLASEQAYRDTLECLEEKLANDNSFHSRYFTKIHRVNQVTSYPRVLVQDPVFREVVKRKREELGIWWPNFRDVLRSFARENLVRGIRDPKTRSLHPRDCSHGNLVVRWKDGAPVARVLSGKDRQCAIVPTPDSAPSPSGSMGRRLWRSAPLSIKFRVGNDENGRPVYVWARIAYPHPSSNRKTSRIRPLPDGGEVRLVRLCWETVGGELVWRAIFIIEEPIPTPSNIAEDGPTVAVTTCWRDCEEGLRVIYIRSEDGSEERAVYLTRKWVQEMDFVLSLREKRKKLFEEIREEIQELVENGDPRLPGWVDREMVSRLTNPRRMAQLAHRLRATEGVDEKLMNLIETWRKRDKHYWQWLDNARRRLIANRNELYHRVVDDLVRRYSTIVVNYLPQSVTRSDPAGRAYPRHLSEEERLQRTKIYRLKRYGAPGKFTQILIDKALRAGRLVVRGTATEGGFFPVCPACSFSPIGNEAIYIGAGVDPRSSCPRCSWSYADDLFDWDRYICQQMIAWAHRVRAMRKRPVAAPYGDALDEDSEWLEMVPFG